MVVVDHLATLQVTMALRSERAMVGRRQKYRGGYYYYYYYYY